MTDPTRIDPDSWALDAALIARPGVDEIMLDLLHDIKNNAAVFSGMQQFLAKQQPPVLVATGANDEIFPEPVVRRALDDLPAAEYHALPTGHFALEDHAAEIAALIRGFLPRARVVLMDIVLPGVDPWQEFLRQPFLWHFAFHTVPDLPDHLVQGRQDEYFRYFYEVLAARPEAISAAARRDYAAAYASDGALAASFAWYRAFARDAAENQALAAGPPVSTPVLYLRGEQERGGDITGYAEGLRRAGVTSLEYATVPGCGHFPAEEAPDLLSDLIATFSGLGR